MEVKIQKNAIANTKNQSTKTIKSIGSSFADTFNQAITNSKSIKTNADKVTSNIMPTTGNPIIDNLPDKKKAAALFSINELNTMFGIDILGNSSEFINKKDSTINMTRILFKYGNNINPSDYEALTKYVNNLRDNGLINDEDYFYTLKWIETKTQALRIKSQADAKKNSVFDSILKSKKQKDIISKI